MTKPAVYIESTVISYYTARKTQSVVASAHREITVAWWKKALPKLDPFISQIVIDEISRGDEGAAKRRLEASREFKVLQINNEVMRLSSVYFEAMEIPDKVRNDSLHLAFAALNGMDYLVTWNCAHIASARVRGIIESINTNKGYNTPIVCTPEELMEV